MGRHYALRLGAMISALEEKIEELQRLVQEQRNYSDRLKARLDALEEEIETDWGSSGIIPAFDIYGGVKCEEE